MAAAVAKRLNGRFREGHPSSELGEAGIVIHQFDNYENRGEPWRPCDPGQCGDGFVGRISCFLAWKGMRESKRAVPLISWGGGIIVSPSVSTTAPRIFHTCIQLFLLRRAHRFCGRTGFSSQRVQ